MKQDFQDIHQSGRKNDTGPVSEDHQERDISEEAENYEDSDTSQNPSEDDWHTPYTGTYGNDSLYTGIDEDGRYIDSGRLILFYVSQYQNKYFYNEKVGQLPDEVKKELLTALIFITEESGGVTELGFDRDGEVYLDSYCQEDDLGYDQVSARLLIAEMEQDKRELLEELTQWYRKTHPYHRRHHHKEDES